MYVIYALIDPRNNQVRYIGLTDDVYDRFRQHVYYVNNENTHKDTWVQEMRKANVMIVLQELQRVEGLEEAKKREAYWIQHYYQLGTRLTNKIIPLEDEVVYVRTEEEKKEIRLSTRMTIEDQKAYVTRLRLEGLSRKTIYDIVAKYIPREFVTIILNACEKQIPSPESLPASPVPHLVRDGATPLTTQELKIGEMFFAQGLNPGAILKEIYPDRRGGEAYQRAAAEVSDAIRKYAASGYGQQRATGM